MIKNNKKYIFIFIMLVFLLALSSCSKDKTTLSTPNNLKIEESILTWDSVDGATLYAVQIDDEGTKFVSENFYSLNEITQMGNHKLKVKATGDSKVYYDSDWSVEVDYSLKTQLIRPTDLTVSNKKLMWKSIADATAYEIKINNDITKIYTVFYSLEKITKGGEYSISVRAIGDNANFFNSDWSQEYLYKIQEQLAKPKNLNITENVFNWDIDLNAQSYNVTIGEEIFNVTNNLLSLDDVITVAGKYTLFVSAIGDNDIYLDSLEASITYFKSEKLPSPTNLSIQNGILTFESVENASGYIVNVNGKNYNIESNSFSLLNFVLVGEYVINVTAKGNSTVYFDSDSTMIMHYVTIALAVPKNLRVEDGYLVWDNVPNAKAYAIQYDSHYEILQYEKYFLSAFTAPNIYQFEVQALSDNNIYLNSAFSNIYSYKVTGQLNEPQNIQVEKDNLTIRWNEILNSISYILTIDDIPYTTTNNYYILDIELALGTHIITVQAMGDNDIYFDSDISTVLEHKVKARLSTPLNLRVENDYLVWNIVDNATSYAVYIENTMYLNSTTYFLLQNNTGGGTYYAYVIALSDNELYENSLESSVVSFIVTEILQAPINIAIEEDYLVWNKINNALSYKIIVDDNTTIDCYENMILLSDIPKNCYVKIIALGDNIIFFDSAESNSFEVCDK